MTAENVAAAGRDETDELCALLRPEDAMRLARLVLAAFGRTADDPLLTNDDALVALAAKLVRSTGSDASSARTVAMALRDLVWRVDTARGLIAARLDDAGRRELDILLATEDIHAVLRRER